MCQTVIHTPKGNTAYRYPQFFVQNDHPINGARPFTQQSRGCGEPGDFVALPYTFLTAWNTTWNQFGDPAKLFVKEWAKFRYGIFDEHGYSGDLLYPNYYKWNGHLMPTGTTNAPLNGQWLDGKGRKKCNPQVNKDCYFYPLGANDQVTCSLGNLHYLPSVKRFCSADQILNMGPTKQNVICKGQSALDVILGHEDFLTQRGRSSSAPAESIEDVKRIDPEIKVVREPESQYVLIMETSASMDSHNQWKWINKAAQKFIRYDLPLHSNLAIVTFSNQSRVAHVMSAIHSDEARARLADTVPDKYHLSHTDVKCLLCGVQQAIQEVLRGNMAGAHLVLLTRGSTDTLSISDEQTIEEYVKYYHLKVSSILIPESQKLPLAFYDSIAQASGGTSHVVPQFNSHSSMEIYVNLMHAFTNLLRETSTHLPIGIHEELIPMTGYDSSSGTFTIDTTLGRETTFGIYVEDEEDHLIKSVSFTDSKGFLYGPYTSMSSLYDIINLKTINFPVGEAPPFDDPDKLGTSWNYDIEWYPGGSSNQFSLVYMNSFPRFGEDDIFVNVWTNADSPSDIVTSQKPLAIYAQVIKGSSPVLRADVTVDIRVTQPDSGSGNHFSLRLKDDGSGGADLVSGDGIYSRYLTQYHGAGRYSFDISVHDNQNQAFTVRGPSRSDSSSNDSFKTNCCGSTVKISVDDQIPTGAFIRKTKGPVLHLLSVPPMDVDLLPPASIKDLKIQVLPKSGQLMASWTAPGDDFDVGRVTGYRFVIAENYSALLDPFAEVQTLVGFQQPDEAGVTTSYQFGLARMDDHYNKDLFMGLLAFDEKDNEGSMSNIVMLHLTSNGEYGTSFIDTPVNNPVKSEVASDSETVLIGSICGALIVIAILLWAGIWYFRNQRGTFKSTKTSTIEVGLVPEDPSPPSTIQRESETLKRHLMQPQMTVIQPQIDQSTTNTLNTPVYWSASQLLDNNNQQMMVSNRGVNTTLDPISEEFTDQEDTRDNVTIEDEELYARGLANYGLQTQNQMRHLHQQIHEPIYVGYSPDTTTSTIYGTSSRGNGAKKIPPKVPPKPSINALLGIGIIAPTSYSQGPSRSNSTSDIYGKTSTRHISHV